MNTKIASFLVICAFLCKGAIGYASKNHLYQRQFEGSSPQTVYALNNSVVFSDESAKNYLQFQSIELNRQLFRMDSIKLASFVVCGVLIGLPWLLPGLNGAAFVTAAAAANTGTLASMKTMLWASAKFLVPVSLFSMLSTNPLSLVEVAYTSGSNWYFQSSSVDELTSLEINFLTKKNGLPRSVRDHIARNLFEIRTQPEADPSRVQQVMVTLRLLLNFPKTARPVKINLKKLEEFKDRYADINHMAGRMEDLINQYDLELEASNSEYPAKKSIFLYGPPGVGKSRIAKEFSELMGLSSCQIQLEKGNPKQVLTGGLMSINEGSLLTEASLGEIARCFATTNSTNPVVIFDDIDRSFSSDFMGIFLNMIDPKLTKISHPILGELDISKVIFLFTANFELKTEQARENPHEMLALFQRFSAIFQINGYSEGYKRKFLSDDLLPKLLAIYKAPEDKFVYTEVIDDVLEEAKNDPGMRVLEMAFRARLASVVVKRRRAAQ